MIDVSHIALHRLAISKQLVVTADAAAPAPGPGRDGGGGQKSSSPELVIPPRKYVSVFGTIVYVIEVFVELCSSVCGCILVAVLAFGEICVCSRFSGTLSGGVLGIGGCAAARMRQIGCTQGWSYHLSLASMLIGGCDAGLLQRGGRVLL